MVLRGSRDVLGVLHRGSMFSIHPQKRWYTSINQNSDSKAVSVMAPVKSRGVYNPDLPPLARMPTGTLLRSIVLTSIMSSSILLKPCLGLLQKVAESDSPFFSPERNLPLGKALRFTVYDHFCAGSNLKQVQKTVKAMKDVGFNGVILGYGKEIVMSDDAPARSSDIAEQEKRRIKVVEEWTKGTLESLNMIGHGDFLAIKFTGAGPVALDAIKANQPMPQSIAAAMEQICSRAAEQGSRIWLDAEQQALQPILDEWTMELMRKYNRNGKVLVYNTIQAYLKGARANAERHVRLAAEEGWGVGIKLVRGAYIEHETRSLIHDTKEETDRSYNDIASSLIQQRLPHTTSTKGLTNFPQAALFLATHNAESVQRMLQLHRELITADLPTILLECGQLQGMADEISYELLQRNELEAADKTLKTTPAVFKCLTWGSLSECMHYLYRRSVENRGAVVRTRHMAKALRHELKRRLVSWV